MKTGWKRSFATAFAAAVLFAGAASFAAPAAAASDDEAGKPLPRRFLGTIAVTSSTGWKTERVEIVVERWTTPEERETMLAALADKGDFALAKAMEAYDVGYVRLGTATPWRLRTASIWAGDGGFHVRVATERPINFVETWVGARSQDYPIGVIQVFVPGEGEGEGGILAASQVRFDRNGRLEVKALPNSTGPHKVLKVREAEAKKAKKSTKDKKAKKDDAGS